MSAAEHLDPLAEAPKNFQPPFDVAPARDDDPDIERWRARRHVEREQAIRTALAGVALGAYDGRVITYWAAMEDVPTIGVLVSLLMRVRHAGRIESGAS